MTTGRAGLASSVRVWPTTWAAYAACAWAFVFAAMSFYWAAGGTAGLGTLSAGIREQSAARDPGFVALVWITGILKAVAGLIALALARTWGRFVPRWLLLVGAWGAGAVLTAYGAIQLVVTGVAATLMAAGVIGTPADMDWAALRWHLLLWDPWWLAGGLLFIKAARDYGRRSRAARAPAPRG